MSDYETGRKARREGQPVEANPYWGWFRRCAWERGWADEEKALRSAHHPEGAGTTSGAFHTPFGSFVALPRPARRETGLPRL